MVVVVLPDMVAAVLWRKIWWRRRKRSRCARVAVAKGGEMVNVRQQAPSGINTEESIQNIWRELEMEERYGGNLKCVAKDMAGKWEKDLAGASHPFFPP